MRFLVKFRNQHGDERYYQYVDDNTCLVSTRDPFKAAPIKPAELGDLIRGMVEFYGVDITGVIPSSHKLTH